jgi:hypothetical protein
MQPKKGCDLPSCTERIAQYTHAEGVARHVAPVVYSYFRRSVRLDTTTLGPRCHDLTQCSVTNCWRGQRFALQVANFFMLILEKVDSLHSSMAKMLAVAVVVFMAGNTCTAQVRTTRAHTPVLIGGSAILWLQPHVRTVTVLSEAFLDPSSLSLPLARTLLGMLSFALCFAHGCRTQHSIARALC